MSNKRDCLEALIEETNAGSGSSETSSHPSICLGNDGEEIIFASSGDLSSPCKTFDAAILLHRASMAQTKASASDPDFCTENQSNYETAGAHHDSADTRNLVSPTALGGEPPNRRAMAATDASLPYPLQTLFDIAIK